MKVWVLFTDIIYNEETIRCDAEVHETKESALIAFNDIVNSERESVTMDRWTIGRDEECTFEAYEDGWYTASHTYVTIEEQEVINLTK